MKVNEIFSNRTINLLQNVFFTRQLKMDTQKIHYSISNHYGNYDSHKRFDRDVRGLDRVLGHSYNRLMEFQEDEEFITLKEIHLIQIPMNCKIIRISEYELKQHLEITNLLVHLL